MLTVMLMALAAMVSCAVCVVILERVHAAAWREIAAQRRESWEDEQEWIRQGQRIGNSHTGVPP